MLDFLRGKSSDRKLRLFTVACCRRIWHLLIDERSKHAVLVVERDADMTSRSEEVDVAFNDSENAFRILEQITARHADAAGAAHDLTAFCDDMTEKATSTALATANASGYLEDASDFAYQKDVEVEYSHQCSLLRDIFGNLFRPVTLVPAWRTPAVVQLAKGIYDDRRFEDLPILADALEEAGCREQSVLDHLRSPGPHVRGCWPLDLILGRA
jgi:hypothetical protein